jgi:uncharacterized protein YecA (UPF0149 family)
MEEYRDNWLKLQKEWQRVHDEARATRAACIQAFAASAAGHGAGPTEALLDQAEQLEQHCDWLQSKMNELVRKALGFE